MQAELKAVSAAYLSETQSAEFFKKLTASLDNARNAADFTEEMIKIYTEIFSRPLTEKYGITENEKGMLYINNGTAEEASERIAEIL